MTITLRNPEHAEMLRTKIHQMNDKAAAHRQGGCTEDDCELSLLLNELPASMRDMLITASEEKIGLHVMFAENVEVNTLNGNTVSSDDEAHFLPQYAVALMTVAGDEMIECVCLETECDHYQRMGNAVSFMAAARQAALKWEMFNTRLN